MARSRMPGLIAASPLAMMSVIDPDRRPLKCCTSISIRCALGPAVARRGGVLDRGDEGVKKATRGQSYQSPAIASYHCPSPELSSPHQIS
jgi:hypothetical protein